MLYLGIDQHARQITISLRDAAGDVVQAQQVSTQPEKINAFFQQLTRERLRRDESFVAVLEVCGFNDWLIRMLHDYHCHKVILIQPDERKKCKTDRRDAGLGWPGPAVGQVGRALRWPGSTGGPAAGAECSPARDPGGRAVYRGPSG